MHIHICAHQHTWICAGTHILRCSPMRGNAYIYTCTYSCTYALIHAYPTYSCTYEQEHICVCIYGCTYMHKQRYTYVLILSLSVCPPPHTLVSSASLLCQEGCSHYMSSQGLHTGSLLSAVGSGLTFKFSHRLSVKDVGDRTPTVNNVSFRLYYQLCCDCGQ